VVTITLMAEARDRLHWRRGCKSSAAT
jgi:hypothetical protein